MMRALGALLSVLVLLGSGVAHADPLPGDDGLYGGYVATGRNDPGHLFKSVVAEWTVPPIDCLTWRGAFGAWVGLGGGSLEREWLIQIGVWIDCRNKTTDGQPKIFAFRETVPPDSNGGGPVKLPEVRIKQGDRIYASVVYDGVSTHRVYLQNRSTGADTEMDYKPVLVGPLTAEAVLEAHPASTGYLPKFGNVSFQKVRVDGKPIGEWNPDKRLMFRNKNPALLQAEPGAIAVTAGGEHGFPVFWRHE